MTLISSRRVPILVLILVTYSQLVISQKLVYPDNPLVRRSLESLNLTKNIAHNLKNNQTPNTDCTQGCGGCGQGHCFTCFERPFDGHQQCQQSKDPSLHCELFTYDQPGCTICENRYMTNVDSGGNCMKLNHPIKNCVNYIFTQGMEFCGICKGGFPKFNFMGCNDFDGEGAAQNCEYGYYLQGDKACFKCKTGYSVRGKRCVVSSIEGCQVLVNAGQYCGFCDVQNNWFALHSDGLCTQSSSTGIKKQKLEKD